MIYVVLAPLAGFLIAAALVAAGEAIAHAVCK